MAGTSDVIEVKGRGRLRLRPIAGSSHPEVIELVIDLHVEPDSLSIGDLRRAAMAADDGGRHEEAYRLWDAVSTAARRAGHDLLATTAMATAEGAKVRAGGDPGDLGERRSDTHRDTVVRFDYDELAAEVEDGRSHRQVAEQFGCSRSTVSRAVTYVRTRDDLQEDAPELFVQLMAGEDVSDLALRYDVPERFLRWLVRTEYDRRG